MKNLMIIKKGEPLVDSREVSKGFDVGHKQVRNLIQTNIERIKRFGNLEELEVKTRKGRIEKFFLLNESQALFLVSSMRNSEVILDFRELMVREFIRIRTGLQQAILNKSNQQWLTDRSRGKLVRCVTTETIEKFVEYATNQGSKNAKMYYRNISSMQNKSLFILREKYPNLRDLLTDRQLSFIQVVDTISSEALREGMQQQLPYKEIYEIAKQRVTTAAELMPKTMVPLIEEADQIPNLNKGK